MADAGLANETAIAADKDAAGMESASRLRLPLLVLGAAIVLVGATTLYLLGGRYMTTDDAYVQVAQVSISSSIAGRVVELDVHDNQTVHAGDVLFRIEDDLYRIAVEQAAAKLATAHFQLGAMKASYRQQEAALHSAQDTLAYQEHEFARQQSLLASGISSRAQFDQVQHAVDAARQQVASAQQQFDALRSLLAGNPNIDPNRHPQVLQAKADLDRAQVDLSYTVVRAPSDGIVTKVEQLQVGDYIQAATPLFSLMLAQDQWIEANFKESQLPHMKVGQSATVDIDAFPQKNLEARVVSLSPATGAQFSALPAENATGNWVKVVQRVPVRLELVDPKLRGLMHSGLSATVKVDTQYHRHLFGDDTQDAAK